MEQSISEEYQPSRLDFEGSNPSYRMTVAGVVLRVVDYAVAKVAVVDAVEDGFVVREFGCHNSILMIVSETVGVIVIHAVDANNYAAEGIDSDYKMMRSGP